MATVKIILRKKKNKEGTIQFNKDGTLPLTMRITKDRKTSFIYLGYSIPEKDWDEVNQRVKKSNPNSARLNNYILKKLSEANDSALELETNKTHVSVKAVRNKIKPSAGSTFFAQAELFLERLKAAGKYNQYTAEKPRIKHFKEFIGHDIAFQDITVSMLERFKAYLQIPKMKGEKQVQLGERSAVNHLVMIRSVFSQAIKDNLLDSRYYPFGKGKIKIKFPDSVKIGLSREEVKAMEDLELLDSQHNHVRNLWLVSYYFAGMRVSDVLRLKWSDIQDNRLHYLMAKNNKVGSLKMPEKAIKIIDQYKPLKGDKDDLIFPDLKGCEMGNSFVVQRTIAFKTSAIDKCLRLNIAPMIGVEKKLTMHIARHTFAQNATNIDVRTLQKLFRHTKLETTEGYMGQFIHQDADNALDSVLGL